MSASVMLLMAIAAFSIWLVQSRLCCNCFLEFSCKPPGETRGTGSHHLSSCLWKDFRKEDDPSAADSCATIPWSTYQNSVSSKLSNISCKEVRRRRWGVCYYSKEKLERSRGSYEKHVIQFSESWEVNIKIWSWSAGHYLQTMASKKAENVCQTQTSLTNPKCTSSLVPSGNVCQVGVISTMWSLTQRSHSISRLHMSFFSLGRGSNLHSCPNKVALFFWQNQSLSKICCKKYIQVRSNDCTYHKDWWWRWRWLEQCRHHFQNQTYPLQEVASKTFPSSSQSLH